MPQQIVVQRPKRVSRLAERRVQLGHICILVCSSRMKRPTCHMNSLFVDPVHRRTIHRAAARMTGVEYKAIASGGRNVGIHE